MADDKNNPQREEVLRLERRRIATVWWMQSRVETALDSAVSIALCPDYVITREDFTELAQRAYDKLTAQFKERVETSLAANEDTFALASSTNKKEEIS